MAEVPSWRLAGDWFDVCRCRVPCACTFAQPPDDGQCDGIPGKARGAAEALTGPTAAEGARVQLHNAPGAEVGPGQVATWGTATEDEVEAFGFKWSWPGRSSKHFSFDWSGPE